MHSLDTRLSPVLPALLDKQTIISAAAISPFSIQGRYLLQKSSSSAQGLIQNRRILCQPPLYVYYIQVKISFRPVRSDPRSSGILLRVPTHPPSSLFSRPLFSFFFCILRPTLFSLDCFFFLFRLVLISFYFIFLTLPILACVFTIEPQVLCYLFIL